MTLLKVVNIQKKFGGLVAVGGVDLEVQTGEIVSVIGPNGAGKTTFFNLISGLYPIDNGKIIFDNKEIQGCKPEKMALLGVSRTFQNIRLFGEMLVLENIMVGMYGNHRYNFWQALFRTPKMRYIERESYKKAKELLDYVGLKDKEEELAKNLSYGQQRKLEIARALAVQPKLLMLDEPAAGLNPKETEEMKEFILKIRRDFGCSILLIEHDMKLVMGLSDKISVINYGVKIAEGKPEDIKSNQEVIQAYLGTSTIEESA